MLQLFRKERVLPQAHDLQRTYDVVIIGAGVHGLATAYYLGKEHGITNVAVLEKSYLGAGNSGRNTAILRANYRTPEGIPFFAASLELYEQLVAGVGLERPLQPVRPPHPRPQRFCRRRPPPACRDQQPLRRREPRD